MIPLFHLIVGAICVAYTLWGVRFSVPVRHRMAWRWVVPILATQIGMAFAIGRPRQWFFFFLIHSLIWSWVSQDDPDEPFRRLKKKLQSSMTKIQQMVMRRQQVEAFR